MTSLVLRARWLLSGSTAVSLAIGMLVVGQTVNAGGPAPIGLGTAASFAILAGTPAVTNTGPTTVTGDLGIHPAAAVTGFPPGTVNGTIHAADAVALQAKSDLVIAYGDAAGRPATATHGTLGGLALVSGVYNSGGTVLDLTGTLTLDGQNDPNSVWVFQAMSSLITASSSSVKLINGASSCNVYWQITSSATLGSGSTFVGTILALTSITVGSGVTVDGRVLARNGDVTLINDTITRSTCSTSPAPGASATPSASATASPTPTPSAAPTPSAGPTPTPTAASSLPPTDTLATTDGSGPGSTPVVLVGLFFMTFVMAFVVVATRRSLCAIRTP